MNPQMILIKDMEGSGFSRPIRFIEKVPQSLVCTLCGNVSPNMKEDSHSHMYCVSCVTMIEEDGKFECENDGSVEWVSQMRNSPNVWDKVLRLVVKCPKSGCGFQASVEEFLIHQPLCQESTRKPCAFCGEQIESKQHVSHVQFSCPKRLLNCPFCCDGIEACYLDDHLDSCDHRPEDCPHCKQSFDTFKELRDVHLMECPEKPIDCPYKSFGCDYQGPRKQVDIHSKNVTHIEILVKRMNDMSEAMEEVKKENARLEKRIEELEDRQREADQYRIEVEDNIDVHKSVLQNLEQEVLQLSQEPVARKRLDELNERVEKYLGPFDSLLNNLLDADKASSKEGTNRHPTKDARNARRITSGRWFWDWSTRCPRPGDQGYKQTSSDQKPSIGSSSLFADYLILSMLLLLLLLMLSDLVFLSWYR